MRSEKGERIVQAIGHNLYNENERRRSRRLTPGVIGVCLVMIAASSLALMLVPGARASPTPFNSTFVKVPCGGNIQNAINGAPSGGTIVLAPCTFVQQLTIDKSVNIVGAGAGKTIIQSPAVVTPDLLGNPWTIELGSGAVVAISGVTVLVTLQCIIGPAPESVYLYAGGGIGVGGSAYLNLQSAVVTTAGGVEGAACGGPSPTTAGILSYGDGIAFGLDYVVGSPPASALLGSGQVSGVSVSGFGYSGEAIGIGGHVDSPAGSSALISFDHLSISSDAPGYYSLVDVGGSSQPCSATIVDDVLSGSSGLGVNLVTVAPGSSAYVAYNSMSVGLLGIGVFVYGSSVTVLHNSIIGPTTTNGVVGVLVYPGGTATISYNIIGQFECAYNATMAAAGLCGPDYATQFEAAGIGIVASGTVVATHNVIFNSDGGVEADAGCSPNCVVQDNVIMNSYDWGLAGIDGSYSFGPNVIIGGAYGVGAIALSVDTTVTLSHVVMVGQTVAPDYYEIDFGGGTATVVGT